MPEFYEPCGRAAALAGSQDGPSTGRSTSGLVHDQVQRRRTGALPLPALDAPARAFEHLDLQRHCP